MIKTEPPLFKQLTALVIGYSFYLMADEQVDRTLSMIQVIVIGRMNRQNINRAFITHTSRITIASALFSTFYPCHIAQTFLQCILKVQPC